MTAWNNNDPEHNPLPFRQSTDEFALVVGIVILGAILCISLAAMAFGG